MFFCCSVEEAKLHNAAVKEKLQLVTEAALDGEEQAAQMEQLLKDQELKIKVSLTLINTLYSISRPLIDLDCATTCFAMFL